MSNTTRQTSDALPGPIGNGRRLEMGGIPCVPMSLLLVSVVAVLIVVAGSGDTIPIMRTFFLSIQFDTTWANVIAALLGLLSVAIVVPLVRALRYCNGIR